MRVFNISLHKMGTTSMWYALSELGFESAHFILDLCWQFLNGTVASAEILMRDNIAVSDLPIPLMYRMLYKRFPDAKFILVTRPFEQWFKSVKAHLQGPNIIPYTHTILYGYPITADDCDEDLCRKVYDRHHADVAEFFSDKGNLLTIDLDSLDWQPICEFLGREIPDRPFPHAYKTLTSLREE